MRNSSSLDWLRFMHTPNDYRVSLYWGIMNKPTGYKKGADAVAPLSAHEA